MLNFITLFEIISFVLNRFQYKCLTSGDFKDFFIEFYTTIWKPPSLSSSSSASSISLADKNILKKEEAVKSKEEVVAKLQNINWDEFFYTKGMPADPVPNFDNVLANAAEDLAKQWINLEKETASASASVAAPVSVSKQLAQSKKELEV